MILFIVTAFLLFFYSKTITLLDTNALFLLTIHLHMPNDLRLSLIDRYRVSLPGHLQDVNTASAEDANTSLGQAIHFDWYNRYSIMVIFLFLYCCTFF